jgi:hypothetical protein
MIAKNLFPEKSIWDLTPSEKAKVMDIYEDFN